MLVEQEQDLRKLGEDWRMVIVQREDDWYVSLSKFAGETPICVGVANNPKRAFRTAFGFAKDYEENLKKSS